MLALSWLLSAAQTFGQSLEYPVKANYLVRFAAFVEWPQAAFGSPQAPLRICVVGRDPFGRQLDQLAGAQVAHGRRMVVHRPDSQAALAGCHIAYAGAGVSAEWLDGMARQPGLLLVTDGGARRGCVHFVIVQNRVRFIIDQAAGARSGLTISSRLLSLGLQPGATR